MQTFAVVNLPGGLAVELVPGDIVGRATTAALQLDDGRVSEAHAMVSLREGQLHLIPLRGGLALQGEPVSHVVMAPGVQIELAQGLSIAVAEVHLPDLVLGVEAEGLLRQMVPAVASILGDSRPRLVGGWREEAIAQLWSTGDGFRVRTALGTRPVHPGDEVVAGPHRLRFVAIPLGEAGPRTTRRVGEFGEPLHVLARFDSVQIHREGRSPVIFAGMQARCLSELVAVDGPLSWTALTAELWPEEDDPQVRRGRLDALLMRLRRRLRATGIRADLVRSDGAGTVELVRYPSDQVEDLG
ncbi:MAG: FHA domain-containing protein [Deltaproteobacteria bacterium]|nr:FHA domain-containing protein [Deltaproteobacteria bacterium]